ncbi:polyprenyl synthetase family protein [Microbacterium sp. LWH12-1.2]|uniref:polyprenyl synthetase family protein n=1 Tax=Microbacterium sp. LWH12-1.2 TaxID=3135259 RepID=UPI0034252E4B
MSATATKTQNQHSAVEDALRRRFAERSSAAEEYGEQFALLWRLAADHVLGGKLIRPRLLLDVHGALSPAESPRQNDVAIEIAANVELLHYAFLLHDDVIDGDLTRRHRPNLIGTLAGFHTETASAEDVVLHWARSGAILMGDLLLSSAILGFARAKVAESTRRRLLDLLEHAIVETVAGEHTDVGLSDGVITPDLTTILSMTAYKTATYSFALPLRAAAILAETDPSVEMSMVTIGRHLGLAYQLQDDHLSMFGDQADHGKDPYADLRAGKETAIIAFARETGAWSRIEHGFGHPQLPPGDAARIREHLIECGAEAFTRGLIEDQLAAAHSVLENAAGRAEIPGPAREAIRRVAASIKDRRR